MVLLVATFTQVVGCAQSVDESSDDEQVLEQQLQTSRPVILEIEKPMDVSFGLGDVSDFAVQTPTLRNDTWRPATTNGRPVIVDRPSGGSQVVDQVRSGFGSGPCRLRLNIGRKEVGVRCKWQF